MDVQIKSAVLEYDTQFLNETIKHFNDLVDRMKSSMTSKSDDLEGDQFDLANSVIENAIFDILNANEHMKKLVEDLEKLKECVESYDDCGCK